MLMIRLSRRGGKKNPFYHVSVMNKRSARDGRFIEKVGYYDPMEKTVSEGTSLDVERVNYWISKGAQMSPRFSDVFKKYLASQQKKDA